MFKSLIAGFLLLIAASTAAVAADRRVQIINDSDDAIVGFYSSNIGQDRWGGNILRGQILYPGDSIWIDFDDRTGYCKFDFKAVFSDGHNRWHKIDFARNVCRLATFTYVP